MFSPPRITMSLIRPMIEAYPASSSTARSPVCIQRAASIASAVRSGISQYPSITLYPRVQNSPGSPRGTTRPVSGSTTFTSTCGCTAPTVDTRRSRSSSGRVCVDTGEVSVMP